jgi:hypothetical protein
MKHKYTHASSSELACPRLRGHPTRRVRPSNMAVADVRTIVLPLAPPICTLRFGFSPCPNLVGRPIPKISPRLVHHARVNRRLLDKVGLQNPHTDRVPNAEIFAETTLRFTETSQQTLRHFWLVPTTYNNFTAENGETAKTLRLLRQRQKNETKGKQ